MREKQGTEKGYQQKKITSSEKLDFVYIVTIIETLNKPREVFSFRKKIKDKIRTMITFGDNRKK